MIKLNSFSGGGEFVASKSYPNEVISAGATGTFKTLTPPSGKRIKITKFLATAAQTNLITISRGGVDVVSLVNLDASVGASNLDNEFIISDGVNFIIGEIDEDIELKTNVATSNAISLMYQEGGFS